jgi:hypothetical protein
LLTTPYSQDTTNATFTISAQQWFAASGTLSVSGMYDSVSWHAMIDMSIDANLFEPSFNANATLTGGMRFVQKESQIYAYINGLSLNATSGDVDGGILNALIGTISKKWISLSDGQTGSINTSSYSTNLSSLEYYLIEWLTRFPLVSAKGKTTVNGSPAYILDWNVAGVSGFVKYILNDAQNPWIQVLFSGDTIQNVVNGVVSSPLSGFLIVHSAKDIELRIDRIQTKDVGTLQVSISTTKSATRWLQDNETHTQLLTGKASIENGWVRIINTLIAQNIVLDTLIKSHGDIMEFTLTTPDVRAHATLNNEHHKTGIFAIPTITDIVPLTQILQWFSMLGWNAPEVDNGTGNEMDISHNMTVTPEATVDWSRNTRK